MAEVIAIIVCSLIVIAFLLACCVMVRNAQRRKEIDLKKDITKEMDEDDGTFAKTKQVRRDRTAPPS